MTAPADAHLRETGLGGQTLLSGGFLEVRRDIVRLPDGATASREYIRHPGAVAVIPLLDLAADPTVVLVRQHRYPIDRVLLEWPAGKREAGEPTIACAQRELLEETGYTATEWAWAGWIHNAAAYSSEGIALWFARGLLPGPARPDAGEFVEAVTLRLSALAALDARGELTDVKTLIGLHWLQAALSGHRSWSWASAGDARDVA
ncbi:MAG: NUDIX domain-containing protein [Betaproteobacteria bacterium]